MLIKRKDNGTPLIADIDMNKSTAEEVANITEEYITALWGAYNFICEIHEYLLNTYSKSFAGYSCGYSSMDSDRQRT